MSKDAAAEAGEGAAEGANDDGKQAEQVSPAETKAREDGWKPESEWEGEDSAKPQEFVSAEIFNERGVWIKRHKDQQKRIDDIETKFNTRMDNANKLHKQQLDMQKSELERKRDEAIDLADKETANKFQGEIDKINAQPEEEASAQPGQAQLNAWNTANPWALQAGPKRSYAQDQLTSYLNSGQDMDTALSNVDADLTSDEIKYYRAMPGAWKSEAEYLQAVLDVRNEK